MGLFSQIDSPAARSIVEQRRKLAEKKQEMAAKMAKTHSPSGQRHDFDRAYREKNN